MKKSKTYIATPPGSTIKEQLDERGMTQKEFAARMDLSEKHISNLINGDVHLTPEVANRLEMVLGLPAAFWNNLEAIYREKLAKVEDENAMDDDIAFAKMFPYTEMAKNKWVGETRNAIDKVINLRKFFEVSRLTILQNTSLPQIAYRKAGESEKSFYALMAWAQKAKIEAREADVQEINIERLKTLLPEIRSMTVKPPKVFCYELCNLMASCGIALVFLPHIGGSFLHGATFADGKKIVVGMTVRGKYADMFWFSLFHEIGHILLGHAWLNRETTNEEEAAADAFARDTLIPKDCFDSFLDKGIISKSSVIRFANEIGVAPGIVVGRLQNTGLIPYNQFGELKEKYAISV